MPGVGISVASLATYTDADLITLYRWALANGAAGQTREIQDRTVTFPDADVMMSVISQLELRVAAANGGTTALAQVGQPAGRCARIGGLPYPL